MAAAIYMFSMGCSGPSPKIYVDPDALPFVEVRIRYADNVVADATVNLFADEMKAKSIVGYFDSESDTYRFVTDLGETKKGGVPVGKYVLTVKPGKTSKIKIPAKYAERKTSDLVIDVEEGTNLLDEIELQP